MSGEHDEVSILDLFRAEAESQAVTMVEGLLALERSVDTPRLLEELMRAAHSFKGAASIVNHRAAVRVAHAIEDIFVAAQRSRVRPDAARVDLLLSGVDLLGRLAQLPEASFSDPAPLGAEVDEFLKALVAPPGEAAVGRSPDRNEADGDPRQPRVDRSGPEADRREGPADRRQPGGDRRDPARLADGDGRDAAGSGESGRTVSVAAASLNRMLGLASESLVASRWPELFSKDLLKLRRMHDELVRALAGVAEAQAGAGSEAARLRLVDAQRAAARVRGALAERSAELDAFDRRNARLANRLYDEVIGSRMRPFSDGARPLRRLVRDVARQLERHAVLEVRGESTPVDREVLHRIESALGHIVRNAVDHGIEPPAERLAAGKPAEGTIRLEARHAEGMLLVTVRDDGRGVDPEAIRRAVVARGHADAALAERMTTSELLEFLSLPGFTLRSAVTSHSGRGVGLDAVQASVRDVGGSTTVASTPGQGMEFRLRLPITLAVMRALVVQIGGERYALPLARVAHVARVPRDAVESVEGREHCVVQGQRVGLVPAHQILELPAPTVAPDSFPVVVIGNEAARFGLVVEQLVEERELAIVPLDPRLGKVRDIASAALLPDGSPVLIIDVDDLLQSIQRIVTGGRLQHVGTAAGARTARRRRVLVVDDSLTVRETERKLLQARGYEVEVAIDGLDGWNTVRTGQFDLVVTDVDMPRMDGIELLRLVRADVRLRGLPVVVVSYKDRDEDRQRGLDAGADYYLTKASFQDDTFLRAVEDLIGGPAA